MGHTTWRDSASPGDDYRPNSAFQQALAAKANIDQQIRDQRRRWS